MAPGLWPLGVSYKDKSPRIPPGEFERRLKLAFAAARDYVWIYGFGSAWQTGGPYGSAPVAPDFPKYLNAVHDAQASCTGSR